MSELSPKDIASILGDGVCLNGVLVDLNNPQTGSPDSDVVMCLRKYFEQLLKRGPMSNEDIARIIAANNLQCVFMNGSSCPYEEIDLSKTRYE